MKRSKKENIEEAEKKIKILAAAKKSAERELLRLKLELTSVEIMDLLRGAEIFEADLIEQNNYSYNLNGTGIDSKFRNYTFVIISGYIEKELLYYKPGDIENDPDYEFSKTEIVIEDVNIYNNILDENCILTEAKRKMICDYLRVHKITS
jgi:hypothetical protein